MGEMSKAEVFVAKVDGQNRITINRDVRDLLGIKPGIMVRARISIIR